MLRQLLSIFRSNDPLGHLANQFAEMLRLARDLTVRAGDIYFSDTPASPDERTEIFQQDIRINKLEREIRKGVIFFLSSHENTPNLPYCLLLMSLVKDAERIGDYAKNLAEVDEIRPEPLPDDDIVAEIKEIRTRVESVFAQTADVFTKSDQEEAVELIRQGRELTHRCDLLVGRIARSQYDAATATATVLGTRYYKRIAAHVLNVLSSVVMPLHKLDYYDETVLEAGDRGAHPPSMPQ